MSGLLAGCWVWLFVAMALTAYFVSTGEAGRAALSGAALGAATVLVIGGENGGDDE